MREHRHGTICLSLITINAGRQAVHEDMRRNLNVSVYRSVMRPAITIIIIP
jgi:hypothetical protein